MSIIQEFHFFLHLQWRYFQEFSPKHWIWAPLENIIISSGTQMNLKKRDSFWYYLRSLVPGRAHDPKAVVWIFRVCTRPHTQPGRNFTHKDPEYRAGDQDNTDIKMMWRRKETRGENHLWSTSMISGKWQAMDSQPKKARYPFKLGKYIAKRLRPPYLLRWELTRNQKRNSRWGRELQVAISPIAKNDWVRLYGFWISGSTTLPSLRYHSFQVPILDFCLFLFCSLQL